MRLAGGGKAVLVVPLLGTLSAGSAVANTGLGLPAAL